MRSSRYGSNVILQIIIVVAVLAFANLVSLRLFARADLTEGNLFSVSESTKNVLRGLDDVINIKVYFSKRLPPYLATLTREVRDILGEYRAYAGRNLIIGMEDPADDPETELRVRTLGIPQVQLNIIEKDKAEVMNGYLGIAILFADKSEVIPVVQNPASLEYDLTSAIVKVSAEEQKSVGFLAGHQEPDINAEYEVVRRFLERQYVVKSVETSGGKQVPNDVNTLVVAGPRMLEDWDIFAIDQFLMRGGRVIFLIDKIEILEGTLAGVKTETGVDSLLSHYGVVVRPDLVVDRNAASATFSTGLFRFTVPYPLWPMVMASGFDSESPITSKIERSVFPWVSSIELGDTTGTSIEATILAKSSPQSWSEERQFNLDPQRGFVPMTEPGARNLAVLLSGRFESFFRDRQTPELEDAEEPPPAETMDISPETQIIVVGTSRFIEGQFLAQYPENRTLFLNIVDWLTLGESLIGIRSRAVTSRPLKEIGESTKATIRFASTFGIPIALILWGLIRRYLRSSRRKERLPY